MNFSEAIKHSPIVRRKGMLKHTKRHGYGWINFENYLGGDGDSEVSFEPPSLEPPAPVPSIRTQVTGNFNTYVSHYSNTPGRDYQVETSNGQASNSSGMLTQSTLQQAANELMSRGGTYQQPLSYNRLTDLANQLTGINSSYQGSGSAGGSASMSSTVYRRERDRDVPQPEEPEYYPGPLVTFEDLKANDWEYKIELTNMPDPGTL